MKSKYDVIVIGSGLGGLVSSLLLAKEGKEVLILEKNQQFGGNLQCFSRDKTLFDTGVHYIGGLGPGENLNRYFSYLDILKDLKITQLDSKFEKIIFNDSKEEYYQVQGYTSYEKYLKSTFPEESEAIDTYISDMKACCASFPLYNLSKDGSYDERYIQLNLKDYLFNLTDNEVLRAVLVGNNFLYAGLDITPFYVHALSVNSYIVSAWRCIDGGAQIAKSLVKRIREHGGEIIKRKKVVEITTENGVAKSVITSNSEEYTADHFISNVDPKLTLSLVNQNNFRKSYIKRVEQGKSGVSCFCVHVVLKENSIPFLNHNYYVFDKVDDVWNAQDYGDSSWPKSLVISMAPTKNQGKFTNNLSVMCYMNFDDVSEWNDTFNTIVEPSKRKESYNDFKQQKIEKVIDKLELTYPDIRNQAVSFHASSPLSFRDYIGNFEGTMYGYEKDSDFALKTMFPPKTKVQNLLLTGQGISMHGILGVTISGFMAAAEIVGMDHLLDRVKAEENV